MKILIVKVKFYSKARHTLPSNGYRPHFIVNGDSEYLGVEFLDFKSEEFGEFTEALIKLL